MTTTTRGTEDQLNFKLSKVTCWVQTTFQATRDESLDPKRPLTKHIGPSMRPQILETISTKEEIPKLPGEGTSSKDMLYHLRILSHRDTDFGVATSMHGSKGQKRWEITFSLAFKSAQVAGALRAHVWRRGVAYNVIWYVFDDKMQD